MNYEADHGSFPPACVADEDGTPMHSWRVLILPYLEELQLYEQYNFSEPWNGPNNSQLLSQMPDIYACPSHGHHGRSVGDYVTNYMLVTGLESVFDRGRKTKIAEIKDGPSRTVLLSEVNSRSVSWMAPTDLAVDDFVCADAYESNHTGDLFLVGYADGHVSAIDKHVGPRVLLSLVTKSACDWTTDD